jgi:hypothetical protein
MVYTDIDSGHLRAGLRIYFIATLTILGLVGSQCCKCAAKLDLVHGKTVKLHRMTGWVRARDVLMCLWKLKRLPGGWWLGLMMVIASVLTLVADLSVALMVRQTYKWDICEFTQGLIMDLSDKETYISPPSNGYPALLASNSQISSVLNGCKMGIYNKVPQDDDPQFCPSDEEILGTWDCEDVQHDVIIPPDFTPDEINQYLYNNSLQYVPHSAGTYIQNGTNFTTHYVSWSTSVDGSTNSAFDVLTSVDLNTTEGEVKTMRTYHCALASNSSALEGIQGILSQMDAPEAVSEWGPQLERAIYLGAFSNATEDAGLQIAALLNSMTMVQGGNNDVFSYYDNEEFSGYGCMLIKTTVSPGVFILVGFAGLILAITTFYWLYLVIRLGKHALPSFFHRNQTGVRSLKPVPDSILSWMLQASRENALAGGPSSEVYEGAYLLGVPRKERELQGWSFTVTDAENGVARMVRTSGSVAPAVEQIYMTVDQK